MALDLVQVRWQLIRATEANISVENENLSLRKEVAALKDQIQQLKSNNNAQVGVDPKFAQHLASTIQSFLLRSRNDLMKMRSQMSHDMKDMEDSVSHLKKLNNHSLMLTAGQDDQLDALQSEKKRLRQQLQRSQAEVADLKAQLSADLQVKDDCILQLREELLGIKKELRRAEEMVAAGREQVEALQGEHTLLTRKMEESHADVIKLQEELDRARKGHEIAQQEAAEQRRQITSHYEQIVIELSQDNAQLRERIANLEEQIARLSNALVGNKSHFAKYVEVKTENLALQCRIDSIAKALPPKLLAAGPIAPLLQAPPGDTGKLSPRVLPQLQGRKGSVAGEGGSGKEGKPPLLLVPPSGQERGVEEKGGRSPRITLQSTSARNPNNNNQNNSNNSNSNKSNNNNNNAQRRTAPSPYLNNSQNNGQNTSGVNSGSRKNNYSSNSGVDSNSMTI